MIDPDRVGDAVRYAADLHATQKRKSTEIPYLSHLLAVAALVLEDGGDEDQVVAALLHDAAEDQGGEKTLAVIGERFGDRVERIVRACSDSLVEDAEQKAPWKERKDQAIAQLADAADEVLVVVAADKLHNLRSTATDYAEIGEDVWERFNAERDDILWYYDALGAILARRIPQSRSVQSIDVELAGLRSAVRGSAVT